MQQLLFLDRNESDEHGAVILKREGGISQEHVENFMEMIDPVAS